MTLNVFLHWWTGYFSKVLVVAEVEVAELEMEAVPELLLTLAELTSTLSLELWPRRSVSVILRRDFASSAT
jgi:hypothetical protein